MNHIRPLAAILLALFVSIAPSRVAAQEPDTHTGDQQSPPQQPSGQEPSKFSWADVSFLTGYRFHLSADSIRTDDPRFRWDAYFGGDIDVVDYRYGRINFLADYEVVLGNQFRHFDPNQGNYYLDLSASWRFKLGEVQGLFQHVSRHLGDRANEQSVAWNDAGVRITTTYASGPTTATVNVRAAKIVQHAFVDYRARAGMGGDVQYRVNRRFAVVGRADLDVMMVDGSVAGRGTQVGGRTEAAVRVYGTGAGVEAFLGFERRIDPYPLERATRSWMVLGFRFVNR